MIETSNIKLITPNEINFSGNVMLLINSKTADNYALAFETKENEFHIELYDEINKIAGIGTITNREEYFNKPIVLKETFAYERPTTNSSFKLINYNAVAKINKNEEKEIYYMPLNPKKAARIGIKGYKIRISDSLNKKYSQRGFDIVRHFLLDNSTSIGFVISQESISLKGEVSDFKRINDIKKISQVIILD